MLSVPEIDAALSVTQVHGEISHHLELKCQSGNFCIFPFFNRSTNMSVDPGDRQALQFFNTVYRLQKG
jgi:hypothetical protein